MIKKFVLFLIVCYALNLSCQVPVARQWNEVLLEAIREDYARPTIHARNLFHVSAAMYDAWAAYDDTAATYFLGKTVDGFSTRYEGITATNEIELLRREAISYAAYRLLNHRFRNSPAAEITLSRFENLLISLGYDPDNNSMDYSSGDAAALGNYIAASIIEFGLQDGSNEHNSYNNKIYSPINNPLLISSYGNQELEDPNRWQPLTFNQFIDQSGQELENDTPEFLSPEWGRVSPFSLTDDDKTNFIRDGDEYVLYLDPGKPPLLKSDGDDAYFAEEYVWGMTLVASWSAHLDTADQTLVDISPGNIGNLDALPTQYSDYPAFYDFMEGGDISQGHEINPITGEAYEPNIVLRADYARVLAEFWADGPDSETPPGHWFTILNYINEHPQLIKKYKGEGRELNNLEWYIKSYFVLGGALHDAAVAAWSIKGRYDYIRPVSAIRWMGQWQSSDPNLPNYNINGLPLIPGLIELISEDDLLAGENNRFVGEIKIRAWRGHYWISNPRFHEAGVGWIRPQIWWPYQRPTFVTPPFAGYVSGHSTFSRAAAEVLTKFTGSEFFPGGIGEFVAEQNEFLVFEDGPSQDVTLQWATYRDASDQTSLSRIWGGIHPPCDDVPGRIIGEKIGIQAFNHADLFFKGNVMNDMISEELPLVYIYPNPISSKNVVTIRVNEVSDIPIEIYLYDVKGKLIYTEKNNLTTTYRHIDISELALPSGIYIFKIEGEELNIVEKIYVLD